MPVRKTSTILLILCFCMTFTTGCWDMTEPNQRALWIASALDETPDGHVEFSGQIAVPSALGEGGGAGGSGSAKGTTYLVKSAAGSNVEDAMQNIQEKISRRVFVGHRDAIFIGERIAKHGLKQWVDEFGRNPESNVRSKIFLIRGGDGKQFLQEDVDLEQYSTTVALRSSRFNGIRDNVTSVRDLENRMLSDGVRPVMQAISITADASSQNTGQQNEKKRGSNFHLAGVGLFNQNAQLVGYLDEDEAKLALWATGDLNKLTFTEFVKNGNGNVAVDLQHLHRRVKSEVDGNQIKVHIALLGDGIIRENNTSLNLFERPNIEYVERVFDHAIQGKELQIMSKVQRHYGTDIYGIGEDIHRRHPTEWKSLKGDWDREFKHVLIAVDVHVAVRHVGNKGPSYVIPGRQL